MPRHTLNIRLDLPEEGPDLEQMRALARRCGLSLDQLISRALVEHAERLKSALADPRTQALFSQEVSASPPGGARRFPDDAG